MLDAEQIFRAIILILFIGARYVRWRARRLTTWQANWPGMKRHPTDTTVLISLAVAWVTAVVIYVAFPGLVAPFHVPLPVVVRWCAVVVAFGGLGLLRWVDRCLGDNLSVTLQIRENHTLVSDGPYRWVRHPIYTATLVYAAALGVITANYVLAALFFVPMALLVALRLGREEQMMMDQFGDEYRNYMKRTGRLLPRIHHRND